MQTVESIVETSDSRLTKGINYLLLLKVLFAMVLIVGGVVFRPLMYAASIFVVLIVFFSQTEEEIFSIAFALLSLSPIFKFSPNSSSVFTYLEIVIIFKLIIRNRKIETKFLVGVVLFIIYVLAGSNFDISTTVKTIMMPIIMYLICRDMNYEKLTIVSGYYIGGVIIGSVLGICRAWIPNLNSFISYKSVHLSLVNGKGFESALRFSGLWGDPNYYSIHLLLVMTICIILYFRKQIAHSFFIVLYGLSVVFGSMTGSKSYFLMAAILTVIFLFSLIYFRQTSMFIGILILLSVVLLLLITGKIDLFSTVLTRLNNVNSGFSKSGLTTGRIELLQYYMNLFAEKPLKFLIGNGVAVGHSYRHPHNTLIDYLDVLGLLGTILSGYVFVIVYKDTPKIGKGNILIALVIPMFFFLSMFYSIDFCFEVALIICFFKQGIIEHNDDNKNVVPEEKVSTNSEMQRK